jgi:hypothetical protein
MFFLIPIRQRLSNQVLFVFKAQRKINIKVLFKNILKIAAFFPFENSLTHGAINQDLLYMYV